MISHRESRRATLQHSTMLWETSSSARESVDTVFSCVSAIFSLFTFPFISFLDESFWILSDRKGLVSIVVFGSPNLWLKLDVDYYPSRAHTPLRASFVLSLRLIEEISKHFNRMVALNWSRSWGSKLNVLDVSYWWSESETIKTGLDLRDLEIWFEGVYLYL